VLYAKMQVIRGVFELCLPNRCYRADSALARISPPRFRPSPRYLREVGATLLTFPFQYCQASVSVYRMTSASSLFS